MKKLGMYSLLLAAILFTGCSQKNVEMDSDSALDKVDGNGATTEQMMTDSSMDGSTSNGVYVMLDGKKVFLGSVYFAFDKYDLSTEMRDVVKTNSALLSAYNGKIKVEGNCDEWGTDEYNYALGLKRAKAVKDALVADGIESSNISLISFGESNPVCEDKNKECWQKNRRADHRLLP